MARPRVFADFQNADPNGRLRLNCQGTYEDLHRQQVSLAEGLVLTLYSEDVEVEGEVRYSPDENVWVAEIDWDAVRRFDESDQPAEVEKSI